MIPLIKSTFYHERETKEALCQFIRKAKKLSFGKECERFEKNFARWQGRKYCIFVNSGSSANLAIIQTLLNLNRVKKSDNVGFSSLTWATNVMPLIQHGLTPVPVDVELTTLNVSSRTLLEVLKRYSLKMLFLTNLLGFCDDIDRIVEICKQRNIILIEDNCESLGTIYKGKKLGNFGIASTFSFYVGHHLSTVEGGAICTDDKEIETMLRLVRAHGWDRNLSFVGQQKIRKKFNVNSPFYSRYTFYAPGYNFRPTEINGAMGNLQLPYLDEIVEKRNRNFLRLAQSIYLNREKYYPVKFAHIDYLSAFSFPVICKREAIRHQLVKKLANTIELRPIVGGDMTLQPFFQSYAKRFNRTLAASNAALIHRQGLYIGINPEMTEEEIKNIIRQFLF